MFEKFPPSIRATIEAFFNEPLFGATTDDHALDLANELEVQHPDLSCRFGTNCPRSGRRTNGRIAHDSLANLLHPAHAFHCCHSPRTRPWRSKAGCFNNAVCKRAADWSS